MKSLLTISLILMSTFMLQGQNTIDVFIKGFKNDKGKAMVGLYITEKDFLKKTFKSFSTKIFNGKVKVSFEDIPEGVYAISVYHDENENGKFDRLFGMIPKENYGNSNNVPPRFGPPQWKDAKFEIKGGSAVQMDIEMM